ncbi:MULTISPECIES: FtsX-like permease family protein [unclassified Streptomyces]|uniref:FtsX-like permease family protein n=1 Tax=unclassified Streptomyces TaxID=2593676 RepID=UPI002E33DE62|nr:FtsX-like permease family protein [Streptomyces sp. NBC_01280]
MSVTRTKPQPAPADTAEASAPTGARAWIRDLGMGMRFAAGGGREGWVRTILTAVGVGLGVALLLGAASVPYLTDHRSDRSSAREAADRMTLAGKIKRSDTTVLMRDTFTTFRDRSLEGRFVRAEGGRPVLPPGLGTLPGDHEMVVSPALRDLLDDPGARLLKERFRDYRVTGTIADAGLVSPQELFYYAGSGTLTTHDGAYRAARFGYDMSEPLNALLMVLVVLICVVLLTPVAVFIGTAVRFGGDRRDRRLAALRLVGADARAVRRIAAGESLFGALLGLAVGTVFFLAIRQLVAVVDLDKVSAFPSDLRPVPVLAALIVVAVPLSAVLVTVFSLRSVAIEPLGVVRGGAPRRRRLWWRLLLPVAGIGILLAIGRVSSTDQDINVYAIATGATLALVGLSTLLPWLLESVVARLRGGPVPWQLATRRLQLSSGTAARAVSGITIAVAGAVALQMMFASMHDDFNRVTGQDPHRAQLTVNSQVGDGRLAQRMIDEFRHTKGVKSVIGTVSTYATRPGPVAEGDIPPTTTISVGTCATLRELARVGSCHDGDTFVSHTGDRKMNDWVDESARPGKPVDVGPGDGSEAGQELWTLPAGTRTVQARPSPTGDKVDGILATPGAIDIAKLTEATTTAMVQIDPKVPDAEEYARNTAAHIDPLLDVMSIKAVNRDKQYASIARGLQIGAAATMALIAASMLVSTLEQLRERKRLLAALTAFGTRRRSMAWSILWQTAIPVALGLGLAVGGGLGLGYVMTRMIDKQVTDWWAFAPLTAGGAALIVVVTLLSLPPLWRMMRPDGLRTE